MAKRCKDCKGRGRWQEVEQTLDDGETEIMQWYHCDTCRGTGASQDPDDGDDYDIGGDSYAKDD